MGVREWPGFTESNMKHNNQIHSVRKFRKYWQRYVKTWFDQPARKKARRMARDKKAQSIAPRPVAGAVRSLGIAVDYRRRNRSVEGKQANVQRLREYKANLVVFPRNAKKLKKGWKDDASAEETAVATQITTSKVMPLVAEAVEVETRKITPEEKDANVARMLKAAWNDARLCGFREKRAKEQAEKAAQEALKKAK